MLQLALLLTLSFAPAAEAVDQDPLWLSQEAVDYFEERVSRGLPPRLRLERLIETIFDQSDFNFHYQTQTKTAEEVFRTRSGNCLAFTQLIIALSRHYDLDARFREVEVAPTWTMQGELVLFNRHVNAYIVADGAAYLIDLVPRVNRIEITGRLVSDERGLAHFYNNIGADWFSKGSPLTAEASFRKALEVDDRTPFIWANLGAAQASLGRLGDAEDSYRRALALDEDNMVALSNLAELFKKQGRTREAERLFEQVRKFREKNPYYHFGLGESAYAEGRWQEALHHYQQALKRKEREHHFHFALARTHLQLGELRTAERHLEKAFEYAQSLEGRERYSQKLEVLAGLTSAEQR